MTEKEVKNWLRSISVDSEELKQILDQIAELRAVAESCTVRTDKESVQSSGSGDKMANIVGKIVDLEYKIHKQDQIVVKRRETFQKIVKHLPDDRQKEFLTVRYFDGNGFYDTVMIMELTDSTARRIERKAISEFTTLMNELNHNI